MTDREKAIVMAHTGICMLTGEKLDVFYQYLAELYGRPVYTHEWLTLDIKEKSKPDFLLLCNKEELERKKGKWIHDGYDVPHETDRTRPHPPGIDWMHCSVCGRRDVYCPAAKTNYCPGCGADMRGDQDGSD